MPATALADVAVTSTALLGELREARLAADAAEVRVLEIAVEWAHSHPAGDGETSWRIGSESAVPLERLDGTALDIESASSDPLDSDVVDRLGWCGIPPVAWDAPAAFAAANQMSTTSGKALIRDALVLTHRLPKIWAKVLAGQVQPWRARRIAQAVLSAPADVVDYIDDRLAPIAGTVGPVTLDRVLAEAMLRLHPEIVELEQVEAMERRHVTLGEVDELGLVDVTIRADERDTRDFDRALSAIAEALKADGCDEPLEVRRSMAIGIFADPEQAQALLEPDPASEDEPRPRTPSRHATVYLHISDWALLGLDPVCRDETTGRAVLTQQVRSWLARTDTHVVVKPVIDLDEQIATEAYEIPDRLCEQVWLTHPQCVFPWCTRPARSCDLDHEVPWPTGATESGNLAPLCRHHHRLKTLAGWRYRRIDTQLFLWTDPHGLYYLRDRGGTTTISQT